MNLDGCSVRNDRRMLEREPVAALDVLLRAYRGKMTESFYRRTTLESRSTWITVLSNLHRFHLMDVIRSSLLMCPFFETSKYQGPKGALLKNRSKRK